MTGNSVATDLFQVMPPLPDDQYALLKADIAARGVLVPVEYDEEGHILDGHHRVKACRELRIEWPSTIRYIPDMQARRQHARTLNLLRRQLTDEQRAQVMRDMRQDGMTIREIAKAAGVSVGTVHNAVAFKNEQEGQLDDFEGDDGGEDATPELEKPHLHPVQSAILANPTQSDRAIAKEIGVENSTVSRNRQKLIATGQLAPVSESKGIDGKTYRGQLAKTVAKSSQVKKAGEALQKVAGAAENLEALELQVRSGETTVKKLEQACIRYQSFKGRRMNIIAFIYRHVAALFAAQHRVNHAMPPDTLIDQMVSDANSRADLIMIALAKQYPELDKSGIFAAVIAQHALYLSAAAGGVDWARRIADDAITAFEYDQKENHTA